MSIDYSAYISSSKRSELYCSIEDTNYSNNNTKKNIKNDNRIYTFKNPNYSEHFNKLQGKNDYRNSHRANIDSSMSLRDFLASIPSFAEFSDQQLLLLEEKAEIKSYEYNEVIFKQGDCGDDFYVIQHGIVDVLVQDNPILLKRGDYGKVVNRLSQGCFFGERALLTSEARAATIKAAAPNSNGMDTKTICIIFSRQVYEEIISGSTALLGKDINDNIDWSKDNETRSLVKHIESILEIDYHTVINDSNGTSNSDHDVGTNNQSSSNSESNGKPKIPQKIRKILYELSTVFTPELSVDEIISRMVVTVKQSLRADRVGLFVLSEDKHSLVLKVSERTRGIRLPVGSGLAGEVFKTNRIINIKDAYLDNKFNPRMDRSTGYRTRQVLGAPLRHPISHETIGVLQVNNRSDGSLEPFSSDQERILVSACSQLSELLHGREEVFIHSGMQSMAHKFGINENPSVAYTADISAPFSLDVCSISLTKPFCDIIVKENISVIEIEVTIFFALTPLATPQTLTVDIPVNLPGLSVHSLRNHSTANSTANYGRKSNSANNAVSRGSLGSFSEFYNADEVNGFNPIILGCNEKIQFDILIRDIPRAARILFRVGGRKKAAFVSLGWVGTTVFDFKGCVFDYILDLKMFPGDNNVPMNTTLSNTHDPFTPSSIKVILVPDIIEANSRLSTSSLSLSGVQRISGGSASPNSNKLRESSVSSNGSGSVYGSSNGGTPSTTPHGTPSSHSKFLNGFFSGSTTSPTTQSSNITPVGRPSFGITAPGPVPINSNGVLQYSTGNLSPRQSPSNGSVVGYAAGERAYAGGNTQQTASPYNGSYSTHVGSGLPHKLVHTMCTSNKTDTEGSQLQLPQDQQICMFSDDDLRHLDYIRLLSFNPVSSTLMTDRDKSFLWLVRYSILNRADLLPAFVMSIKWNNSRCVQELYDLLSLWRQPSPIQALQLLDRRFMDPKVRAYAAHCLEELNDNELALYMLQLCQQLKFESHIDSALSRYLLRRALNNQRLIGHIFFWFLQSEVYNPDVKRRFGSMLEIYIRHCGSHRIELGHQMFVMKRLEHVAMEVVKGETKAQRLEILKVQLRLTVLPEQFQLPLNPHIKVKGIDIKGCKVMESKKKPLWLTLTNADPNGEDIVLMLKVGDDLRQDALILQLLKVMDGIWRSHGLNMQMMIYDCISTGEERGLLQVVKNATTLANILSWKTDIGIVKHGGTVRTGSLMRKLRAAKKALYSGEVIKKWIYGQVVHDMSDSDMNESDASVTELIQREVQKRTETFMISAAAYCVASYVLGLGDRHNDNLMVTKFGNFFHIDFGHILGNFKSKFGFKRERAPFVFTYAMRKVMSDQQFESFTELCCDLYNILRDNATLLVSLCSLAIPCNLPELRKEEDVVWIYDKMLVGKTDEEARLHFKQELYVSLNTFGTRFNDAVHMIAHA